MGVAVLAPVCVNLLVYRWVESVEDIGLRERQELVRFNLFYSLRDGVYFSWGHICTG